MIRHRTNGQVLASAEQMDVAVEHGIRPEVLAELVAARGHWHDTGTMPPLTSWARAALGTAAASEWDAVFTHAALRCQA